MEKRIKPGSKFLWDMGNANDFMCQRDALRLGFVESKKRQDVLTILIYKSNWTFSALTMVDLRTWKTWLMASFSSSENHLLPVITLGMLKNIEAWTPPTDEHLFGLACRPGHHYIF